MQKSRCFMMLDKHKWFYKASVKTTPFKYKKFKIESQSMVILVWVQVLATITAFFSFWLTIATRDPSVLMVLIPAVFVDASAVTALVLWKRKNEKSFSFFSDEKMREAVKWFIENGIDPVDFFRALKE